MKPIITTHDAATGIETQREMTEAEIAELLKDLPDGLAD